MTLTPKFDSLSNLTQLNLQQLQNILQSNVDVSSCLANCSNQGTCKLDPQTLKYICECNDNFTGVSCQTNKRPCSRSNVKCMNNATCINSPSDSFNYTCQCLSGLYFGEYCENKRNPCENRTCSSNGYCIQFNQNQNQTTKCKCNNGYDGDQCELQMNSVKIVKNVQWVATFIAILTLVLTFSLFIASDVLDYLKIGNQHIDMDEWRDEKYYGGKRIKNYSTLLKTNP